MAKKTFVLDDYKSHDRKRKDGFKISSKLVVIIIIIAAVIAGAAYGVTKWVDESNSYIATVDGRKISIEEFDNALKAIVSKYLEDAKEDGVDTDDEVEVEKFWNSLNEDGKNMRLAAKEEALAEAAKVPVQLTIAEEQGIKLTQIDKVNLIKEAESEAEYYANYYTQMGYSFATPEEYVESAYGVTYAKYKEMYIQNYIISKLANSTKAKYTPTDEELKAWYEKDSDMYNLYVVDSLYISYLDTETTENDDGEDEEERVLLEGDKLKEKTDLVSSIEKKITDKEKSFTDLAKEYTENSTSQDKLSKTDDKVTLANCVDTEADLTPVNDWLNETGLKDAEKWIKIEVKGKEDGDFKDKVVGVYFVKYDSIINYDTKDNDDAVTIRTTVKNEVLADLYEKDVKVWAAEKRFEPVLNKDIYKNFTVAGVKAE